MPAVRHLRTSRDRALIGCCRLEDPDVDRRGQVTESLDAVLAEIELAAGADARFDGALAALHDELTDERLHITICPV